MDDQSINLPRDTQDWIASRVAEGEYGSADDYVAELIRRDREAVSEETIWLRGLIKEGLASPVLKQKPADIIEEIIAERRARRG